MRQIGLLEHSGLADVLVVGGGTAGCVVAARLAERGDRTVCLLEAGPDYAASAGSGWPEDLLDASTLPLSHDWGYVGQGAGGQHLEFHRARVIGGCSSHNGCAQSWGWAGDFDRWAAAGLTGWSAADVGPLYRVAAERMRVRRYQPDEIQPFQAAFVTAVMDAGVPCLPDLDSLEGKPAVDVCPVNVVNGVRWNAAFAYLDKCRELPNLSVIGNATVHRVLLEGERVRGILASTNGGSPREILAATVVLCAGAYGSPELLLRSGIGPVTHLEAVGVKPLIDLPAVGTNLHDHVSVELRFQGSTLLRRDLAAFAADRWLPEEQAIAKLASSISDGPYDLHVYPWTEPVPGADDDWVCVVPVAGLRPRSRGRVLLNAMDPSARPIVDHGFLTEPADVRILREGLEFILDLVRAGPLSPYLATPLLIPGGTDVNQWIRDNHTHYWHPGGTCAMGANGVVDADGAVRGVAGPYIADASVFPDLPRATLAMSVVVAAERIVGAMP